MTHEPLNPNRRRPQGAPIARRIPRQMAHAAGRNLSRRKPKLSELRGRRMGLLIALSMGLGFELAAAALTSPLFSIDRIVIRGGRPISADETRVTESVTALPAGTNLFLAPLGGLEGRVRTLPWIETAHVRWTSPHSLGVLLKPRDAAVIATIGGRAYELDAKGVPVRPARAVVEAQLPRIDVGRPTDVHFGVPIRDSAVLAAINLYRDALRQPMVRIAKIRVDPDGNMCLNMLDGIQVQLGQPEELGDKMRYIQRVYELDPNAASRMVAINLSYPKQPACTLKSEAQTRPDGAPGASPTVSKSASGDKAAL